MTELKQSLLSLLQLKYLSVRAHIHTHKLIYSKVFHGISQVHKSIVCWIYFMRNSNVHIFTETPFCFDSFKYFRIKCPYLGSRITCGVIYWDKEDENYLEDETVFPNLTLLSALPNYIFLKIILYN